MISLRSTILSSLVLVTLLSSSIVANAARIWTDSRGQSVNATFVRLFGEEVVLRKANGDVFKVPIATLSEKDQAYLRSKLAAQGFRAWTSIDGKRIEGRYLRVRDGDVYLRVNDAPTTIPFERFSRADQMFIREQAAKADLADQLPAGEITLPPARIWADTDGQSVTGRFDRALPDGRLLLAVNGETVAIAIDKLSATDHEHLRTILEPLGMENLVPPEPKPELEPEPPTPIEPEPAPPRQPETTEPKTPDRGKVDGPPEVPIVQPRPVPKPREKTRVPPPPRQDNSRRRNNDWPRDADGPDVFSGPMFWLAMMGSIFSSLGHFWAAAAGFSRGEPVWGLLALFCCPFDLVYAFMIKDENSGPLGLMVVGIAIQALAILIAVIMV